MSETYQSHCWGCLPLFSSVVLVRHNFSSPSVHASLIAVRVLRVSKLVLDHQVTILVLMMTHADGIIQECAMDVFVLEYISKNRNPTL